MIEGEDLELFARSVRQAAEAQSGPALDAALEAIGWEDALVDDRRAAVSTLFEVQGSANATSSALDAVLLHALGLRAQATAILLPALGECRPPGALDGTHLTVAGVATAAMAGRATAVVVAATEGKQAVITVPTASLAVRDVRGIDPALGLVEVGGDLVASGSEPVSGWDDAVALGQLALGHELVGASRRMLDLAREHALDRIQFGRPIATFQAVRHRLADTLVAVEMAEAMLDAAWLDGSPLTASMAKAVAGRSARTASRHCQQVLAGIGFTTEHPFHLSARRVLVLDQLLGSSKVLTKRLGDELLRTRQLPPLLPL